MPRRPQNNEGTPADPVPFIVVTGLAFMLTLSLGPLYCLAYGIDFPAALAIPGGVFVATAGFAYQRMIRLARPAHSAEVGSEGAFRRLLYVAVALAIIFVAITLPLLEGF
ncbi:MAG: hypothetical protein ABEH81_13985 [Halopenitus sp.]